LKTIHRIKAFIDYMDISLNSFDKSIGRPAGYIGKQIRSEASIGSDILETILRTYTNLSPQWLIFEEGEMLRDANCNEQFISQEPKKHYGEEDYFESLLLEYLEKKTVKEKILKLVNDKKK